MIHYLKLPAHIDPFLIAQLQVGPSVEGVVIDQFSILVHGIEFKFEDADIGKFRLGAKVFLHMAHKFWFETEVDSAEKERKIKEYREQEEQRKKEADQHYYEEAIRFNNALSVPVKWVPGQKDVLSGLSERSWGDGRNAASVYHVLLKADLHDGRLHRSAGDFLCAASLERNGKRWTDPEIFWTDNNGNIVRPKVTCKSCLKMAERWKK